MRELFGDLSKQLVEFVIYSAIALVFLSGLFKCILPYRRSTHFFRRAVRQLELMTNKEGTRPVWQDVLFLGKPLQDQWKRFLHNAEHLDTRGLACATEDYINDEDVYTHYAHLQLAEVIPGLLTSLGILGTFIGLMRGLGNLDISTGDSTMQGISQMISGMTFAYGTSIAGVACSLLFNVLFRASQGAGMMALDDFNGAFSELVMQRPVDDNVYHKCHLEDQAGFLSRSMVEMNQNLSSGIEVAIERAFVPISQSINSFILSETQGQMEGLNNIVGHFIAQMNGSLNGQFLQLAKTLSSINQAQSVSFESISHTMNAADAIMSNIQSTQAITQAVIERFDHYVSELSGAQEGNAMLAQSMSDMLSGMHQSLQQQSDSYDRLLAGRGELEQQMQQYAAWSGRVLEAVEKQSDTAQARTHEVANEMSASAKALSGSYASFVENISTGLARTLGMFEENMHDMMRELGKQLTGITKTQGKGENVVDLASVSKLQIAMSDMTAALNKTVVAIQQMAEGA
ncbi:MAG: MotA/TolQ/ExbB proton channel family protein [Christensenellales bacterium]